MIKKLQLVVLTISIILILFFIALPALAQETPWPLDKGEIETILGEVRREPLTTTNENLFFDSLSYCSDCARKSGAVVLVKQAILNKQLNYWFKERPLEISKKFIKLVIKIAPALYGGDVGSIIGLIEDLSVSEATEYALNWFLQNEIRVGSGELDYSFDSYKGQKQIANFQYLIVYHPPSKKISLEFYSQNPIEPPKGTGPDALARPLDNPRTNCWPWDRWLLNETKRDNDGKIEPFIVRVQGYMEKNKWGNYAWAENKPKPVVEVDFNSPVPQINESDIVWQDEDTLKINFYMEKIIKPGIRGIEGVISDLKKAIQESGKLVIKAFDAVKGALSKIKEKTNDLIEKIKDAFKPSAHISGSLNINSKAITESLKQISQQIEKATETASQALKKDQDKIDFNDLIEQFDDLAEQTEVTIKQAEELLDKELLNQQAEGKQEKEQIILAQAEEADSSLPAQNDPSTSSGQATSTSSGQATSTDAEQNPSTDSPAPDSEQTDQASIIEPCSLSSLNTPQRDTAIFNEIAWMGTENSNQDEWLGLKNISSSALDLNNWQVLDKKGQIAIVLENTILESGGFLLLERTDDQTLPHITADIIYTGSLNNQEETVYLFDHNCDLQDQVVAISGWPGGDNDTKQTMERTPGLGWQTSQSAGGTPKAENSPGQAVYTRGGGGAPSSSPPPAQEPPSQEPSAEPPESPEPADWQGRVFITEIQIATASSSDDDLIKIYNSSTSTLDFTNWQLKKKTSSGQEYSVRQFPQGAVILPESHFTWLNSEYVARYPIPTKPDATSTQTIAKNNSVALFDPQNNIIDRVAWGSSSDPFLETAPFPENPDIGQALQRKFSTTTSQYQDTNNNSLDFELYNVWMSDTQTSDATTTQTTSTDPGQATSTDPNQQATTTQATSTDSDASQTAQTVVISEVQIFDKEFVELYNPKDAPATTTGWYLSYFSQNDDWEQPQRNWQFPDNAVIPAKSHFLISIYDYPYNETFHPKLGHLPNSDWQVQTQSGSPYGAGQLANTAGSLAVFSQNPASASTSPVRDEASNGASQQAEQYKIDAVGWGQTIVKESTSASPHQGKQSLSRKQDESGNFIDANNNQDDFTEAEPSPFNSLGETIVLPPGIANLAANPSPQRKAIDLFWLAPYKAQEYIIKMAEKEITEQTSSTDPGQATSSPVRDEASNGASQQIAWQDALLAPNSLLPQDSGNVEVVTISNLDPTKTYYFAVKYTDENGLTSIISNSPKAKPLQDFKDKGDNTIFDPLTSLFWLKDDQAIFALTSTTTGFTWQEANTFSQNLLLCQDGTLATSSASATSADCALESGVKYDDWRAPSFKELATIIDFNQSNPAINQDYFPNASSTNYWTSSSRYNPCPGGSCHLTPQKLAQKIDFTDGEIDYVDILRYPDYTAYLRPVRGPAPTATGADLLSPSNMADGDPALACELGCINDNNNTTITDNCAGLMWLINSTKTLLGTYSQGAPKGTFWQRGVETCLNLVLCQDGSFQQANNLTPEQACQSHQGVKYDDWRMPSVLENIIAMNGCGGIFPWASGYNFFYWSNTTCANDPDRAFATQRAYNNSAARFPKSNFYVYLQCVRDTQ